MKKLTPKQATFVIEYLVDMNATQAAIRAGYSENTAGEIGHENLNKPNIQEAIQYQMDARASRTMITADSVLADMRELAMRCLQKKPVVEYDKATGKWVDLGEWQFDSSGANRALENLAKNLKLLQNEDKGVSVNVFPNKTIVFKDLDDKDERSDRNIHEPEGSSRISSESEIQSP